MLALFLLTLFGSGSSARLNTRIINGDDMAPNEMPFLAILDYHTGNYWHHQCGGALIAPNKVLTTAHCIYTDNVNDLRVVLGEHSLYETEATEQYRAIQSIEKHPGFNSVAPGYPNDLAVITLSVDADISSAAVSTIPLAIPGSVYDGENCVVAGWGSKVPASATLQPIPAKGTVNVISHSLCDQMWSNHPGSHILPGHVCTFGPMGHSSCHFDFGGPMVCNGSLGGVMSWGDIGCGPSLPSVMSSVPFYHSWIQQKMLEN